MSHLSSLIKFLENKTKQLLVVFSLFFLLRTSGWWGLLVSLWPHLHVLLPPSPTPPHGRCVHLCAGRVHGARARTHTHSHLSSSARGQLQVASPPGPCPPTPLSYLGIRTIGQGFPGSLVVRNPPAHAGDRGSLPGRLIFHMPWGNQACALQPLICGSEASLETRGPPTVRKRSPASCN